MFQWGQGIGVSDVSITTATSLPQCQHHYVSITLAESRCRFASTRGLGVPVVSCVGQVIGVSDPVEATIECYHRAHRLATRNRDIG